MNTILPRFYRGTRIGSDNGGANMTAARGGIPERFRVPAMDQVEHICRNGADQQLHCVVMLDGRVDEERLAKAVSLTLDSEPVLGCRFVERTFRPHWERRDDLGEAGLCSTSEGTEAARALTDFITVANDPSRDTVVRLRVLRSETDAVCVKLDHSASDAGGIKEYVYLLCATYRRLEEDPGWKPAPGAGGDRTMRQLTRSLGFSTVLRSALAFRFPRPEWGFPWEGHGDSDREFAMRRVPPGRFALIREYGRIRRSTINDVVLAAYFRALFALVDTNPDEPMPVQVPIDLRRYLPGGKAEAVTNISGQLVPMVARIPGEEFSGTLERVRDAMDSFKADSPGVGNAVVIAMTTKPGFAICRYAYDRMVKKAVVTGKTHPFLSNMGALDPGRLDFGRVGVSDAYLVSPVMFPPGILLGVSSFNDTMTLTLGYSDARRNRSVAERFLDAVERELKEAAVPGIP